MQLCITGRQVISTQFQLLAEYLLIDYAELRTTDYGGHHSGTVSHQHQPYPFPCVINILHFHCRESSRRQLRDSGSTFTYVKYQILRCINVRNSLKNQNTLKHQRANTKYNVLAFKFDSIGNAYYWYLYLIHSNIKADNIKLVLLNTNLLRCIVVRRLGECSVLLI